MIRSCWVFRVLILALCWVGALPVRGWTPDKWFAHSRSPRLANYRIEAALDWQQKTLEGKETLTWKNGGQAATSELPLHLYLNAFKGPGSLFMKEGGAQLRNERTGTEGGAAAWGYCRLRTIEAEGQKLTWHYGEDESVAWVRLPRAVHPGESISVEIAWESRFPKVFARSGYGGNFLMASQWFPKVGVYQGDRWNCHAYHSNTEYFSDFGVYDVAISMGNGLSIAHTGTALPQVGPNGVAYDTVPDPKRKLCNLWTLHAEDVHDFAFAVMPDQSWRMVRKDYRGVQVFYYYQPENYYTLRRQQEATEWGLRLSGEWYFPYPYPVLTVVDVPREACWADGMEYPTLFTAGSTPFEPIGLKDDVLSFPGSILDLVGVSNFLPHLKGLRGGPEDTTLHEFGHQYFYGLLANHEAEEAWLDEGFTSFFTHKAMQRGYQGSFGSRRFAWESDFGEWRDYWADPSVDPLTRKGYLTRDESSYGVAAYRKPTLVLEQLEAYLGRPVMEEVLRVYAQEMAFRHPTAVDFHRIAERVSGRNLGAFWRDFVEGTEVLDYAIQEVKGEDTLSGGWMEADSATSGGGGAMTFVPPQATAPGRKGAITLVRRGGIMVPLTLWVRLENHQEQRLVWDGKDRWITYEFDSPVSQAILDPDGNYPMLKDRLHSHYSQRPTRRGFHYWAQLVWGTVGTLLQTCGLG